MPSLHPHSEDLPPASSPWARLFPLGALTWVRVLECGHHSTGGGQSPVPGLTAQLLLFKWLSTQCRRPAALRAISALINLGGGHPTRSAGNPEPPLQPPDLCSVDIYKKP